MPVNFVIIGAGQAGGWAAKTLRDQGAGDRIVLIGDEPHPPHERPPLSKEILSGAKPIESAYIFLSEKLAANNIEIRQVRAERIDRKRKQVTLATGDSVFYDRLLLATGSRPRRLDVPGSSLAGIHYLRSIEDSTAIRQDLSDRAGILIVGGGWIGLEVACAARKLGARVTVVERASRVCCRALPDGDLATWLLDLHRRNGVEVLLQTFVRSFSGAARVERALLSNGEEIPVSAVVIGIGIEPNVELARTAGLAVDDGIVVDELCRTSDPDIFAAGDCANHPNDFLGRRVRLESWANAQNQSIAAAKAMTGEGAPYQEIPWFWSDQYHVNLQLLGLPEGFDRIVTRGDPASGQFVQFYIANERVRAVVAANNPRDLRLGKKLMQSGGSAPIERLADSSVTLQDLVKRVA